MDIGIGGCGIRCAECPGYRATQAHDRAALQRCATAWSAMYHAQISADYCLCDGCLNSDGWQGGHCAECDIRACVIAHGVANCAQCAEFACGRITAFMQQVPEARRTLERIQREMG